MSAGDGQGEPVLSEAGMQSLCRGHPYVADLHRGGAQLHPEAIAILYTEPPPSL